MSPERCDLADGFYVVAPGKLVNAVTWLEMRQRPGTPIAEALGLSLVTEDERDRCRDLYRRIGTPWLWNRAAAKDLPRDPAVRNLVAHDGAGQGIGVVELTNRAGEIEISYFGLLPEATGRGLGRRLMAAALDLAWRDASRVWLHSCSFDHPAALRFYVGCGFKPYATGFEIMDDPRLTGTLPRDAGPHVPLIG